MINTDSYYEIGAGHTFCQDYADSGTFVNEERTNLFHYAIVCDGCSGSKDSDIGARWFAKNFPVIARKAVGLPGVIQDNVKRLYLEALPKGMAEMNSPLTAFDATIVAILFDQKFDILHTFVWGDGKVFLKLKTKDELAALTDISYLKNAPYYLSYQADIEKDIRYEGMFGTAYADIFSYLVKPDSLVRVVDNDKFQQKSFYDKFPDASKNLSFASVFTDGIDTYHKIGDVETMMPRANVFNQLTQYKNLHGEFVKRRMQNVKKFCDKEGWQHFDDVSVATIAF